MIILSEVAKKLEAILNGVDEEVNSSNATVVVTSNPTPYYFKVETEGLHLDHIVEPKENSNFIPVFISSMGGQFNPVKGLKQGTYSLPISFYFPVRFKDDFFALGEFLVDAFVGTILNYGPISGRAVSNISAPQFGEIQDLDLKQFKAWTEEKYQMPVEVMEPYLSMNITLFLSNAAQGLVYGNDFKVDLSFSYNNQTFTLKDIDWDGSSIQSNSQAQSEQEEETNESDGLPFGTAYGSSFKIYPNFNLKAEEYEYLLDDGTYHADAIYYRKSGNDYIYVGKITESQYNGFHSGGVLLYTREYYYFYKELLKIWFAGNIQQVECDVTFTIADDPELKYTRKCFIQSVMAPIEKGQLLSLTLSFSKKVELEDEDENEE